LSASMAARASILPLLGFFVWLAVAMGASSDQVSMRVCPDRGAFSSRLVTCRIGGSRTC
jgi:hypothetical protein